MDENALGWLAGWDKRVKLTIDQSDITAALTDFPVLIYLSSSSGRNGEDVTFVFDEVGANSLKIAVTEDDGTTECYVEIEEWDLGNEVAWLWAKVPSISSGADTDIYLYYDNDHADNAAHVGVAHSVVAQNVWDDDFVLVLHMEGANQAALQDSTAENNDVSATVGNPTYQQSGKISDAVDYDGAGDAHDVAHDASLNSNSQTIELWVYADYDAGLPLNGVKGLIFKAPDTGWSREFSISIEAATGFGGFSFFDGVSKQANSASTTAIHNREWFYVVGTKTLNGANDDGEIFINAISEGTDIMVGSHGVQNAEKVTTARVSSASAADRYFNGLLDEIRISEVTRSDAWINATYESGIDDLIDFGNEEAVQTIDLPAEFDVRHSASEELPAQFVVRGGGTEELAAHFELGVIVGSVDLPAEFEVGQGSEGLSGEFVARRTGTADLLGELTVRHADSADLLGEFIVRHSDSEVLLGEFDVRRSSSQELLSKFIVRQAAAEDLPGELIVRQPGSEELLGEFAVRRTATPLNLPAEFIVRHSTSQELLGEFIVRHAGSQELGSSFEIRLPFERLFCKFYVRPLSSTATDFTIIDNRRVLTVIDTDREMAVSPPRRRMKIK